MSTTLTTHRVQVKLNRGKRVAIPAWRLASGLPGPTLLLTAAQHGNEVQGAEVIRRFLRQADGQLIGGQVIAVPLVNVPAVRERRPHIRMRPEQPYGDARGHNMNRWWPGKRSGNDTARIPAAVYDAFGEEATHVLDLHCWEKHNAPAVLIRDRPDLRQLARAMGHRFVDVRPPADFTLGGYFCATGRVGITFEFAGQYTVDDEQVTHGVQLIRNLVTAVGMLAGEPEPGAEPVLFSDECRTEEVTAPRTGLFVGRQFKTCAPVARNAVLGHILSEVDLSTTEVRAPVGGYLRAYGASRANCDVAMPGHHPYVTEGERLARIQVPQGAEADVGSP